MTSPDTIRETIALLRRRVLEINRLIARLERERMYPREAAKTARYHHRRAAAE